MANARWYVPLSVHFFDDDRMLGLSDGAQLLFIQMLCRSKSLMSDGRLSVGQMPRLGRVKWRSEVSELIRVDAVHFDPDTGVYAVLAWFSWNEPAQSIMDRRAADRERKRLKRQSSMVSGRNPDGIRHGLRTDSAQSPALRTEQNKESGSTQ